MTDRSIIVAGIGSIAAVLLAMMAVLVSLVIWQAETVEVRTEFLERLVALEKQNAAQNDKICRLLHKTGIPTVCEPKSTLD